MSDDKATRALSVIYGREKVFELLRTPGLSIRHLDASTKSRVREEMETLHFTEGVSLTDIAKLIGNETSGYVSWLFKQLGIQPRKREGARRIGIRLKSPKVRAQAI